MNSNFPDRAQRLDNICSGFQLSQDFPLLKAATLEATLRTKLRNAVNLYLYSALDAFYHDRSFNLGENLFETARKDILGLPNITPNGLILPKKSTFFSYNIIHATVAEIFETLGLQEHVHLAHAPINLRLVDGAPNPEIDGRPRASVKMHSDMWAGEPASAIMVFLPVFGEYGKIGVKWIEPVHFPEHLLGPLDDFDEGVKVIDGGAEYDAPLTPGEIVLADPYLVHATQKDAIGLRLSVDFRFIPHEQVASDARSPGTRLHNYHSYQKWADIGRNLVLTTDAPLVPFTGKDEGQSNDYAAEFNILKLDA